MRTSIDTGNLYVPILKAKAGEADAFSNLPSGYLNVVTPLFDISRPSRFASKTLDDQIGTAIRHVLRAVWKYATIYLDTYDIPLDARCDGGRHPVTVAHALCSDYGITSIPVTGLERDEDHAYAVRNLRDLAKTGLCLRLEDIDIEESDNLKRIVTLHLELLGVKSSDVDLLIDHRSLIGKDLSSAISQSLEALQELRGIGEFRSIILGGSNFPSDVGVINKDGYGYVPRVEYNLWKAVSEVLGNESIVRFADYGIVHPDFIDLGPVPNANAKIRYTSENNWLVFRGHKLTDPPGYAQYHALSKLVVADRRYCGSGFSYGDRYIEDCANQVVRTGNLRTWVAVDMNHHLHFTARQVLNYICSHHDLGVTTEALLA